ncbi:MAG TPA: restriction endonuclease [Bosea sp. (in: a-proteobacteria)]|uniref:restriction endonuclease n=1 Tax=Bosea sp. (in: a-proteobacteria) TaxID=1871050 RepID=UPI002DDCA046|nr:restriction endonuclease [Bosea sp. (in: a-proteobacteria)]HEV2554154.1 restriction endonuclease [Bosea sp. (in: a-proteobacteria)]
MSEPTVWGVHMGWHVDNRPIDGGYVAIGWPGLGDIRAYPDREAFKVALAAQAAEGHAGAVPVQAGVLFRFTHEMKAGDIVVYPSKHDRMVNIGRFTGQTSYVEGDGDEYPNRREVEWLGHYPRNDFSQAALNEIGSYVTLFRIRRHAREILAKIGLIPAQGAPAVTADVADDTADDDAATGSVSRQAEETTADFVIRRIMADLSGYRFEELVAHVLECMGYTARVTPRSNDGGVDVIAHMDALGFQPPIVKVQCKRVTSQTGSPEVNQLLGTLGDGEFGLFVNLGSYSRSAVELERNRPKLRLINGEQFVELIQQHYGKLAPRYRSLIPLKLIYVPDLPQA